MPNQPPSTLASFKFTTIGKPPSLLMRISNNIDPSATGHGDAIMQDAGTSPFAAPTVAHKAPRPLTGLQRPSLLEQLAPEAHSMNAVHGAVAGANGLSSAGSAVPSGPSLSTLPNDPIPTVPQSPFQTPSTRTISQDVNHSSQHPSFPQFVSNPVIRDGIDHIAPPNSLSSQTYPLSAPSQTHADPATELYNKLTALASESVQWSDIDTLARRFREERDEYRRCHDETHRARTREKEQMETVIRVTEATFDRLVSLKEGQKKRFEEERERLTISARAVGLVPSTSAAVPFGGNVETPTAPDRTEHHTSPLPTQMPVSPTHVRPPTDGPTLTVDGPTPIISHTVTTRAAANGGADDMIIDGGDSAPAGAEEQSPGVRQQPAAHEEQSAAEVENEEQREHQAVKSPRPQPFGDEEAHETHEDNEARREQERALQADVARKRELDEAEANRKAQELAAVEVARKRQELAEAEAARVKRDAQAQEDRRKRELEEAAARKARELDAQRERELAAQKKHDEAEEARRKEAEEAHRKEAEEVQRREAEARQQELKAQEAREMAAAEERRVTYEARRKAFLAEKRAQEEQAALQRHQELMEKIERDKAASEEAAPSSSAPTSSAPITTTPTAQKPSPVISTKKGDIPGKTGGDAAVHSPLGKAHPPTVGASTSVAGTSSGVNVPKKVNRKIKEQSVPVKLEAASPPPTVPELKSQPELPRINRNSYSAARSAQKMLAAEETGGSQIPPTALSVPSPTLPLVRQRWQTVRPQDQVILGPKARDWDRSGITHPYTMVVRPTPSVSATVTAPVLPNEPVLPPAEPFASTQTSRTRPGVARGEIAPHDDNGMVNDPRQDDYMSDDHDFRAPTPERYARDDHHLPSQAALSDSRRMDNHWSPQRSYQRRSPPRKRMRDDEPPAPYPPPRRARYSGSTSSHGSPTQRRALLPEVSRDRARTPPRWQPSARPLRRGASRSPTPRDTYRPRSPEYDVYSGEVLRAASPVSPLAGLAYPRSPSPQWPAYDTYSARAPRVATPPPRSPPMAPVPLQEHGLLDRITEPVRPKRNVAAAGRKQTANDRRPGPSHPAKRGKAHARNATMSRGPFAPLADRLTMGGLESRIS